MAAHRSDLLEVAITAPGAVRTNGIACAVVLPDRGAMNATTVSSQEAKTAWPAPAAGSHQLPEREPGLRRVQRARVGAGQRLPQAHRSAGGGLRVSARIRGLRARAATGSPGAGRSRAVTRTASDGDAAAAQATARARSLRRRSWGCAATPARYARAGRHPRISFRTARRAARDRGGQPGCGPEQPGQSDQRPADRSAPPSRPRPRRARPTAAARAPGSSRVPVAGRAGWPGRCRRARARGRPG